MKVGEQHLAGTHAVVLLHHRLLDLEHQVAGRPHVVGVAEDRRARGDELVVGDRGADTGVLLDVDLVTMRDELMHARGRDGHAVLMVLDFLGDSHSHGQTLLFVQVSGGAL